MSWRWKTVSASLGKISPPTPSRLEPRKTAASSSAFLTTIGGTRTTLRARAAAWMSASSAGGCGRLPTIAMRVTAGAAWRSSSTYLPPIPVVPHVRPVMFRPGRARLATKPSLTGSSTTTITMGMVFVASRAARFSRKPVATITSTPASTSSRAYPATRSDSPPATYPSSRRPSMNASHCGGNGAEGAVPTDNRPIRGILRAGCAEATSAHDTSASTTMLPTRALTESAPAPARPRCRVR